MQQIKDLERINLAELEAGTPLTSSWHAQYRASNYVYVGGLAYTLTEGDVECMMSQFGTVVDLNLARNEDTGDSKGFAFVAYADWRSTVLAVDNFNGTELLRRRIRVDHVSNSGGKLCVVAHRGPRFSTTRSPMATASLGGSSR